MKKFLVLFSAFLIFSLKISGQLSVTTGFSAQQLANTLAGYNIQVTNATISGNSQQFGKFQFTGNQLGVNSGVILSTGRAVEAIGPNTSGSTSTGFGGPGHPLLTGLAGYQTYDAVVFQFQFQVQSDQIEFKYIFLSEEYNEYVGTGFNDVFAFFISGPGITGEENLAVVPGTTTPVSINTINGTSFWQFYRNNDPPNTNIQFDGFTTLMTAKKTGLVPCQTYTLKLMIADGSDDILDSGVLLQENSLIQPNISATANTFSENDIALEGCINASFTFALDSAMQQNTSISIGIGGTAINGIDYATVDPLIIIPAGQTSATIVIDAVADGIPEGTETIELYYSTGPCQPLDTVVLYIDDYNLIEFITTPTNATCYGASDGVIDINVSGGLPPYYITLTDSATGVAGHYTGTPVTGLPAATYYVNVMDGYGCIAEDIVNGAMYEGGMVFLPDGNGMSYSTSLNISGFAAGQVLTDLNQLQSICINMEHSFMGDLELWLQAPNGTMIELKHQPGGSKTNLGEPVATGPNDTQSWNTTPGVGYDYCFTQNPTYGTMVSESNNYTYTYVSTEGVTLTDSYLPQGSYQSQQSLSGLLGVPLNGLWTLIVTDEIPNNNGYVFYWSISLTAEPPDSIVTVSQSSQPDISSTYTPPDCGLSNGSINLSVTGSNSPYTFNWSSGQTTQNISANPAGTYTVTITGNDNCTYTRVYDLSNSGTLLLSGSVQASACTSANNGSVDLSVTGGSIPFTFLWSNLEITEDISGLQPDIYTVTVTDGTGCLGVMSFTVNELPPIGITAEITNENCGDHEGVINITVSGGSGVYNYIWSNSATAQDITDLVQGNYSVTVTDSNGCTAVRTYTITNYVGNCIPNCDINITSALINDEICGNGAGSADITVFTSFSPYTAQWSNGATTDDVFMLHSGTYTVTLTDAQSCQLITTYTVLNQSGTLNITNVNIINETCGNGTGAVNLTPAGGALPYTFLWSNGSTTQNITGLHQGVYLLTLTDANGCIVNTSATVNNNAGTLVQTFGNVVNETCGNGNGSIDIQISGGNQPYTYLWSNGSATQDLINIDAGIYSCTVTDASGCKLYTPVYNVINLSGTMALGYTDIDDEVCGNSSGSVSISVSGGAQPYSFLWSNAAVTQNISGLQAGGYSCTITDNAGCSLATPVYNVINTSGNLSLSAVNVVDEVCGNSGGSIDITVSGGTAPLSYLWSNSSVSQDLLNITAGNYSCTVTDANNCQLIINTSVSNMQGTLDILNILVTDENCGNAGGQVNVVTGGGTSPYSYIWNTGQTTEDLTNITAGNYVITITDSQGCTTSASVAVNNTSGTLALTSAVITNEICSATNGSVNITVAGTETPLSYLWSNGAVTEDITGIPAGNYTCTVTDNTGCKIIAGPYTVNNSSPGMNIVTNSVVHENCGDITGMIDISVTGGTTPFTYLWSNSAVTQDISGLSAGNYIVTVTDSNNCIVIKSYIINNNSGTLNLTGAAVTNELCSNGAGAVNITIAGDNTPFSFLWSNGAVTEDLSGLQAGSYRVTITDAAGCSVISPFYVVGNNPGTFAVSNIIITDEVCGNGAGSINISISGATMPVFYNWSNGAVTQDITGLISGNYTCTATDNIGCEITIYATVENDNGTLTLDNVEVTYTSCNEGDGSIDITVTGGTQPYTYLWSNGATTEDISNLNAGTYNCLVTDFEGCFLTLNAVVNLLGSDLLISNAAVQNDQCGQANGMVNITVNGGLAPYSYNWSNGFTTQDIFNLTEGIYSVTVTDLNGCSTTGAYNIYDNNNGLVITSSNIVDEYCTDGMGAIDISVAGNSQPFSFQWSNGSNTEDVFSLIAGIYSIIVTDAIGCTTVDTFIVINNTNGLAVSDAFVGNDSCNAGVGFIDLSINGGNPPYTYLWNINSEDEDIYNLTGGFYSCTITDNSNCIIVYGVTLNNTTNGLIIQDSDVADDYCSSYTGSVNLTTTGGTPPYNYIWNYGQSTEDITNISAGDYSVTITDNTGCSMVLHYTVNNTTNPLLGFQSVTVTDDYCGEGNGSISFVPNVPGNYVFELNGVTGGQPVNQFGGLSEGNYLLTIWETSCRYDTSLYIGNASTFSTSVNLTGNEYCGACDGYIDLSVTPAGNYLYSWNNNVYTQDNFYLCAGVYSCTITNQSGCIEYFSYEVFNITDFNAVPVVSNEVCGNSNGSIELELTGSFSGTTFLWSNGSTQQNIYSLSSGIYTCTATNGAGCAVVISATVANNTDNFGVISYITDDFCNEGQGIISLLVTGDPGPYDFLWNTGFTGDTLYNVQSGNYSVSITNLSSGCVYINSFNVGNSGLFTTSAIVNPASCQTCSDGAINLSINGAGSGYVYLWSNGATTQDVSSLLPGIYTVTVTDDWGCVVVSEFTVGFYTLIAGHQANIYMKIYPNPSNGVFNVEYETGLLTDGEIDIYDLFGRRVNFVQMQNKAGIVTIRLETEAKGLYLVKLRAGGKSLTGKLSLY